MARREGTMPRNRKLIMNNEVRFVTMRTERGLPLLATPFMRLIIEGLLARAKELYPVIIGDLIVMGNHIHMFLVVLDPGVFDLFIRYFKTESAHVINALKGELKGTIWEEGYDAPPILTMNDLIRKSIYIYTNPQRANLVRTIEEYPNLSTWRLLKTGCSAELSTKRIRRLAVTALPAHEMSIGQTRRYSKDFENRLKDNLTLNLNPKACFEVLKSRSELSYDEYRRQVIDGVRQEEARLEEKREEEKRPVLGNLALISQSILRKHTPSKFGRRMICICSDIALRIAYIKRYRAYCEQYCEVYRAWQAGDRSRVFPPGFFPPGIRPTASLWPVSFWN